MFYVQQMGEGAERCLRGVPVCRQPRAMSPFYAILLHHFHGSSTAQRCKLYILSANAISRRSPAGVTMYDDHWYVCIDAHVQRGRDGGGAQPVTVFLHEEV